MRDELLSMLKRHEGLKLTAYRCSEGVLTIGYGHTGSDVKEGMTITEADADNLLLDDVEIARADALLFPFFHRSPPVIQIVVVNMLFNLGLNHFKKFFKFNTAMSIGDYETSAKEMLDSKWAGQVGDRAQELAYMVKNQKLRPS